MAYDFHELSPYVLIGNPLTLAVIEFFAVPAALLGAVLYPLGLDGRVWAWLGLGIEAIMRLARWIGAAPASNLPLPAFAPWSIGFLTFAVLSALLWRSLLLRLTAIPLLALGLPGAASGEKFDLAAPPTGDGAAVREASGELAALGRHKNAFAAEQWLRADGDARDRPDAAGRCDKLGCTAIARNGAPVALVLEAEAFHEDCARAKIVISPLYAPRACARHRAGPRQTRRDRRGHAALSTATPSSGAPPAPPAKTAPGPARRSAGSRINPRAAPKPSAAAPKDPRRSAPARRRWRPRHAARPRNSPPRTPAYPAPAGPR